MRFREPIKGHEIEIEGDQIRFLHHGLEEEVFLSDCDCKWILWAWEKATPLDLALSISFALFYPQEVREALFRRAARRKPN
jgi:hypothetical protein